MKAASKIDSLRNVNKNSLWSRIIFKKQIGYYIPVFQGFSIMDRQLLRQMFVKKLLIFSLLFLFSNLK